MVSRRRNKYDVALDTHDHSIISKCPAIYIKNYNQEIVKKWYLTIIHMWDEISMNLLSSRHDTLENKLGEILIESSSEDSYNIESASSSTPSSS